MPLFLGGSNRVFWWIVSRPGGMVESIKGWIRMDPFFFFEKGEVLHGWPCSTAPKWANVSYWGGRGTSSFFFHHFQVPCRSSGGVIANQYNEIGSDPHPVSRSDLPDVPVIASLPVSRREIFTKWKLLERKMLGTDFEPENPWLVH